MEWTQKNERSGKQIRVYYNGVCMGWANQLVNNAYMVHLAPCPQRSTYCETPEAAVRLIKSEAAVLGWLR